MDNLWKNPCDPQCPKRSWDCHATCARYKVWKYRWKKRAVDLWEKRRIDQMEIIRHIKKKEMRRKHQKPPQK